MIRASTCNCNEIVAIHQQNVTFCLAIYLWPLWTRRHQFQVRAVAHKRLTPPPPSPARETAAKHHTLTLAETPALHRSVTLRAPVPDAALRNSTVTQQKGYITGHRRIDYTTSHHNKQPKTLASRTVTAVHADASFHHTRVVK